MIKRADNKKSLHSRDYFRCLKTRSQACESGFCETKKIWNLRNEPIARNSTDCILFKISKIVIGPKYNSQVTNYNVCLFHGTIKNGIKGWHILSSILILCQNSLAKPHWKFFSEPRKKLYGNQSQFRFLSQLH